MEDIMMFNSTVEEVGMISSNYDIDTIKNEPMFFSSSLRFAYDNGGMITREFIENLPVEFLNDPNLYMDSRVHMLMPGWFPCIPGWHHDDVPRNTHNKQPNYINPPYRTKHIVALVNAEIAPTEFLIGKIYVPTPLPNGDAIYKQWDDSINIQLKSSRSFELMQAPDKILLEFTCDTFHRGTAAVKNGWRWFGRASIGRKTKVASEIRRQVQVYMPTINAGW